MQLATVRKFQIVRKEGNRIVTLLMVTSPEVILSKVE